MMKQFKTTKKAIFICQIKDTCLKVLKCVLIDKSKREFAGLEIETIPQDADDKTTLEKLNQIFKKLKYDRGPVIISLPRNLSTLRYLKVPAQSPQEIEKIVSLQAPRYLPYPANELITGYQIISTYKDGYTGINMIIVHKSVIERYLKIFQGLNIKNITVTLSSYGLCNLYDYIKPGWSEVVMIIDIDFNQAELVIASRGKVLFSRYFKLNQTEPNWQDLFIDEINKTKDACIKEVSKEEAVKTILTGSGKLLEGYKAILNKKMSLPVEVLSYKEDINISQNLLDNLLNSEYSFSSLIGLGLKDVAEYLNLMPEERKIEAKKISQYKERLRLGLLISGIILIFGLGIAKDLDNKAKYIQRLKIELNKIAKEAKPFEEMEKRFLVLENRSQKKPTSLDILYEIHQIVPTAVSLINLSFEEDNQLTLRGQTQELNYVFAFVSQLEKSSIFKNFNIKVRYATQRRTQIGEIVDFEIICLKK